MTSKLYRKMKALKVLPSKSNVIVVFLPGLRIAARPHPYAIVGPAGHSCVK